MRFHNRLSFYLSRSQNGIFLPLVSANSTRLPSVSTVVLLGLGFLVLATVLRVVFLDWGLPYIYHPDEPINIATIHKMIAESDFDPHFFQYPSLL